MRMAVLTLCLLISLVSAPAGMAGELAAARAPQAAANATTCKEARSAQHGPVIAGRGCCSWHGGQCGCENGRVKCCDGTLSPTCRCMADTY
ncbi:hypothetical protein [Oceanidesulfovibrio marinus]|uniref:Uncharacterized protein n=1 Tax=Oceanidesulfovibrio marinus TaxID=370038 RepID=A0ABX6NEI9_9BACT|nr:hypothetical protein [Oceanidesulfovibrio marinus]QJT08977.1 hypothetical protein E8L03_08550 [Oceanidesulfovibrio marinus]